MSLLTQDKKRVCEICGESDPRLLEDHHIWGRNFDPETRCLCKNCHYLQTREQNKLSPRKRSRKAPKSDLEKFALLTAGTFYKTLGEVMLTIAKGGEIGE